MPERSPPRRVAIAARVLAATMGLGCVTIGPYLGTLDIDGRLVDEATRAPIEGATVFAVYRATDYLDFGGGHPRRLRPTVAFARTDAEGRFAIPRKRRVHAPVLCATTDPYPNLVIVYPPYGAVPQLGRDSVGELRNDRRHGVEISIHRPDRPIRPDYLAETLWRGAQSCYWTEAECRERCRAMVGDRDLCRSERWPIAPEVPLPADFRPGLSAPGRAPG
jgi:hypothetical protein